MNKPFLFLVLLVGVQAQAVTWISCGCNDHAGDFKRSCYSTTSCDTCCTYERSNGSHPKKAKGDVMSTMREDHEVKNMMTMMQDGPR